MIDMRRTVIPIKLKHECKFGDPMCPCQDGDACHYLKYGKTEATPDPRVYGEWCRDPKACFGKNRCPRDPNCGD